MPLLPDILPSVAPGTLPDSFSTGWRTSVRGLISNLRPGASNEYVTLSGADATELRDAVNGDTLVAGSSAPALLGPAVQFRTASQDSLDLVGSSLAAALSGAQPYSVAFYGTQNVSVPGTLAFLALGNSLSNAEWTTLVGRNSLGRVDSIRTGDAGQQLFVTSVTPQDRARSYIFTWDGATLRSYVDGVFDGSVASATVINNPDTLSIGSLKRTNQIWHGNFDANEMLVATEVWTPSEIADIHANLYAEYGFTFQPDANYDPTRQISTLVPSALALKNMPSRPAYAAISATVTGGQATVVCARTNGMTGSLADISIWIDDVYSSTFRLPEHSIPYRHVVTGVPSGSTLTVRSGLWGQGTTNTTAVLDILGDGVTIQPRPSATRRLSVWGDSIAVGGVMSNPHRDLCWNLMRSTYPGIISIEGWGGAAAGTDSRSNTQIATDLLSHAAGATTVDVWIEMQHNDYSIPAQSAASYQTQIAAICDAINLQDATARVFLQGATNTTGEATPNSFGDVLQDYRDAAETVASTRDWCTYVDGDGVINAATHTSDGIHPNETGNALMATAWQSALDDWRRFLPGLRYGWRRGAADEYITTVGGEVDSWTDYVAGSVLTAPSASFRPDLDADGGILWPTRNGAFLDGTGPGLLALFGGTNAFTVIVSLRFDLLGFWMEPINIQAGGDHLWPIQRKADNGARMERIASGVPSRPSPLGTAPGTMTADRYRWASYYDGTNLTCRISGGHLGAPTTATTVHAQSMAAPSVFSLGRGFQGAIDEILIFDRALSTAEVDAIHANLATDYPS